MQTQAIASMFQDFTGHLKDDATELKGSEENKIRMFSAVVAQRRLYDSRTRCRSAAIKKTC